MSEFLRVRFAVAGRVQGVGFRPFVYRLARELGLRGWVNNTPQGVVIEVEGATPSLDHFRHRLRCDAPTHALITGVVESPVAAVGEREFTIHESCPDGPTVAFVPPDLATCPDCLRETLDPRQRRFRYPFTNCTNCGPRFSIIEALPYDRIHTTMRSFPLCAECRAEYHDPGDRRFHAQPIACPACGPHLAWWTPAGDVLAERDQALLAAADAVRRGRIVAVKGLGGFLLVTDARAESAVRRLRERKGREAKPLAVMAPSLAAVREWCVVPDPEAQALASPECPIVLLRRRPGAGAASLAPGNPHLGVMLPYTPLHHLLLRELGFPVVATSGNRSDEPICTEEREACARLADVADDFLVHNRPIARPVDDSVLQVAAGAPMLLRCARGYAPLSTPLSQSTRTVFAVGGQLKSSVALCVGGNIHLSQHLGDLDHPAALQAFEAAGAALRTLYAVEPERTACDQHPDYGSTRAAEARDPQPVRVQHHFAHVAACLAEHGVQEQVLGVSWDGTGYGPDGTIWGGEFLLADLRGWHRFAHLRTFPLPGGEHAVREPRRAALGLLYEADGAAVFADAPMLARLGFTPTDSRVLAGMLRSGTNAPRTSSAGRLFDAVAALLGLVLRNRFEGEGGMAVEYAAADHVAESGYALRLDQGVLDWQPWLHELRRDLHSGVATGMICARVHAGLAQSVVDVARRAARRRVVLTGGCFQNRRLLESCATLLRREGFEPLWPRRIPPNDGGLAVGQAAHAAVLVESHSDPVLPQ